MGRPRIETSSNWRDKGEKHKNTKRHIIAADGVTWKLIEIATSSGNVDAIKSMVEKWTRTTICGLVRWLFDGRETNSYETQIVANG